MPGARRSSVKKRIRFSSSASAPWCLGVLVVATWVGGRAALRFSGWEGVSGLSGLSVGKFGRVRPRRRAALRLFRAGGWICVICVICGQTGWMGGSVTSLCLCASVVQSLSCRAAKRSIRARVELSWCPRSVSPLVNRLLVSPRILPARTLPSSTPHWSKLLTRHTTP